jgi:tRNA-2-methylthio-N6-dimethylallyladenosine synthase
VVPVLFERKGREPGEFVGRTPYLQLVHAAGVGDLIGRTANVAVNETRRGSLSGVIAAA